MKIECQTFQTFIEVIESLVQKGIMFEADASIFVIKCTGGF